jgi:hypothetical protein
VKPAAATVPHKKVTPASSLEEPAKLVRPETAALPEK